MPITKKTKNKENGQVRVMFKLGKASESSRTNTRLKTNFMDL